MTIRKTLKLDLFDSKQMNVTKIKKTSMNSFGGTSRINHDSNKFYDRKLFSFKEKELVEQTEQENNLGKYLNRVLCKNSERLKCIPDSSVHLMVTSPPYNVGKDYDEDLNLTEYVQMLDNVFAETYRILVNGGRVCINIANVGRKPYIPYHKFIIDSMLRNGFLMRGEVIWEKGTSAGSSTAWGSWLSASNPVLRDTHEYILMFSKGKYNRIKKQSTITRDEFLEYTKSVWSFKTERAKKVNHPAPFPIELPYRCIQLYTFKNDIIFDPFCGSGSSAIAAISLNRNYLMIDNNSKYTKIAKDRINSFKK